MSDIDSAAVARWRALGLSDAEIGRRLGVSADRLRDLVTDVSEPDSDDNAVDAAEVR